MPANPHAEVERVIAEALMTARACDAEVRVVQAAFPNAVPPVAIDQVVAGECCDDCLGALAAAPIRAIRAALDDGRLTPAQVGTAVGLRAALYECEPRPWLTGDPWPAGRKVSTATGPIGACLAVALEDADAP